MNNNNNKLFKVDQCYNPMLNAVGGSEQPSYRRQVENMLTVWTQQHQQRIVNEEKSKQAPQRRNGDTFDQIMDEHLAHQLQQLDMADVCKGKAIEPTVCSKKITPSRQ